MDSLNATRPDSQSERTSPQLPQPSVPQQAAQSSPNESPKPKIPLPPAAVELLGSLYRTVSSPVVALRMWERCFTAEERDDLDNYLEHAYRKLRTIGMWQQVRGGGRYSAAVKIAYCVGLLTPADYEWLLRLLGEATRSVSEHLVASARLVIVEYPRELFWEHRKVDISWEAKPAVWNYLLTLADGAAKVEVVDRLSLGEEKEPDYLSKMKSLLKRTSGFPRSLVDCIRPAGRGSQRLTVSPDQIVIVRSDLAPL